MSKTKILILIAFVLFTVGICCAYYFTSNLQYSQFIYAIMFWALYMLVLFGLHNRFDEACSTSRIERDALYTAEGLYPLLSLLFISPILDSENIIGIPFLLMSIAGWPCMIWLFSKARKGMSPVEQVLNKLILTFDFSTVVSFILILIFF